MKGRRRRRRRTTLARSRARSPTPPLAPPPPPPSPPPPPPPKKKKSVPLSPRTHLDRPVEQIHLVDEQVPEHPGAVDDDVHARPPELLERDHLQLVHAAERVGDGPHADHDHHLRERLAVGLDVVGAPEHDRDRLGPDAAGLGALRLEQPLDDDLGRLDGGGGRDRLRVERVDVLARRQHARVADRVAAGPGLDVAARERLPERAELVVLDDLLEAALEVAEGRLQLGLVGVLELGARDRLLPRRLLEAEPARKAGERVGRDVAIGVEPVLDERADHAAARLLDLLVERHDLEVPAVVPGVDGLDVLPDRAREDARQPGHGRGLDVGAVDLGDVDERRDRLSRRGRLADDVQAARQQPRLDLHQLGVDLADHGVAVGRRHRAHRRLVVRLGQRDVAVEVALPRRLDDRRADGLAPPGLAQALVGRDQLFELLEPLVEPGVLGGRGQVRDRVGVRAALGDRRLGRVVGSVVVEVGDVADERVRVAAVVPFVCVFVFFFF